MKIPSDALHHITLVVSDIREAAGRMARMYGITRWDVLDGDGGHLSASRTQGFDVPFRVRTATGVAETGSGPVTFELVQPIEGWSIYQEWLLTRGEGIVGMAIAEISRADFAELAVWLEEQQVKIAQTFRLDGVVDRIHLDTRDQLGGFYVELLVSDEKDWRERIKFDETWDLSEMVPDDGPLLPIAQFIHFGVVVRDLMKVVPEWHRLFGEKNFMFMNWHNAPDSLVDPVNNGAAVDHAYFTTTPTIGHHLSYELIQPTFGPSHYKEDFLLPLGEGIHHIFAGFLPSKDAWDDVEARMAAVDVPVCMGGGLGDEIASFFYLDTRKALPGYVTEFIFPGGKARPPEEGFPFTPAMTLTLETASGDPGATK